MGKWAYIIGLVFCYSISAFSASINEIQEVRLAKAEEAIIDGNRKAALKLIYQNLHSKHFHLPTYFFLAQYHYERGDYSKAFKVYYFIIRKKHDARVLKIRDLKDIKKVLKQYDSPSPEALQTYFKIAEQYYELYDKGHFGPEYNETVLELAAKYFFIAEFYEYQPAKTKYYLGLIENKRENYQEAVVKLTEAKEIFEDSGREDSIEIDNINILLGDNLVRQGKRDAGLIYLKSVYLKPNTTPSLREYANVYLNAISDDFVSATVGLNRGSNSNVERLSDRDITALNIQTEDKDSSYNQKYINLYYSSKKLAKYFSARLSFNFNEVEYSEVELTDNDLRSLEGGVELQYDNLLKSLIKLRYSYEMTQTRIEPQDRYTTLLQTQTITPQYLHNLSSGVLTWSAPLSFINSSFSDTGKELGLALAYSPFWRSRYFSPTYAVQYEYVDEINSINDSSRFTASLNVHSQIQENQSLFSFLEYVVNANATPNLAFNELRLSFYYSYLFKKITGLSLNGSLNYQNTLEGDDDSRNVLNLFAGVSFSF